MDKKEEKNLEQMEEQTEAKRRKKSGTNGRANRSS